MQKELARIAAISYQWDLIRLNFKFYFLQQIKIYDRANIHLLPDQDLLVSQDWVKYLVTLMKTDPKQFVRNFNCEYLVIQAGKKIIPIVKNDNKKNNSHLTSISIYYTLFALESLKYKMKSRVSFFLLRSIVLIFGRLINISKLDKSILVNFWFLPTGPATWLTEDEYVSILAFLKEKYPGHAVIFRGYKNYLLIDRERSAAENLLLSKIAYVIDDVQSILKKSHVKESLKFARQTAYLEHDKQNMTNLDLAGILNRYNDLYIDKYSEYSLQFTENWFKLLSENKDVYLKFRKKDDKVVSFTVFFLDGEYVSSSVAAVEMGSEDYNHLYSLNFASRLQVAMALNKKLNLSSGGDTFKKKRGGQPRYEYDIIHFSHLKGTGKLRWKIFFGVYHALSNRIYNSIIMNK